jgi:hypothetical protein
MISTRVDMILSSDFPRSLDPAASFVACMALPLELYTSCASMRVAEREVLPCHDTTWFRNILKRSPSA